MIQANELRIGNNVNFQQFGEVEVSHVNEELCGVRVREKDIWGKVSKITLSVGPEHLTAIRLSPTVLARCGFAGDESQNYYSGNDIELQNAGDYSSWWVCSAHTHDPLKYLHQLQNLVFVMTGQELKISEK